MSELLGKETILPSVHIGDGAIIEANYVGGDVEPYPIVAGNPARQIRKRFDGELTQLLLEFRWWDLPVPEISELIPLLSDSDLDKVKNALKDRLKK
jgi:virginiamycin A acetyltransferase